MDDAGQAIPAADEGPDPVAPERFFAHGAKCPGCGYALEGCPPGACPECGAVAIDLAHDGRIRELTDAERARAAGARMDWRWRDALGIAVQGMNSVVGSMFLVTVLVFVLLPLLRGIDRRIGAWQMATEAVLRFVALLAILIVVQLALTARRLCVRQRERAAGMEPDLETGRVEEYLLEITHAMRVSAPGGPWLVLRLRGGGVLRLTAEGQRGLGLPDDAVVRRGASLAMLPRARVAVGLGFDGEPIPTTNRTDLRGRAWIAGAGEPVVSATRVEELVRVGKGCTPPFAPTGESHVPFARG